MEKVGEDMEQWVYDILNSKGNQYGLPEEVWFPIVMHESGGNPYALGDNGNSHGLFQINKGIEPTTKRQMHSDFDTSRLSDVSYQADYFMDDLKAVYEDGKKQGLSGVALTQYVERYGERPAWTQTVANSIAKYYAQITGGSVDLKTSTSTLPSANTSTTTSSGFTYNPDIWNVEGGTTMKILNGTINVILIIILIAIALYSAKEVIT